MADCVAPDRAHCFSTLLIKESMLIVRLHGKYVPKNMTLQKSEVKNSTILVIYDRETKQFCNF